MAVIGAAVDSGTKEVFESLARARSVTSSRLAAVLIRDFIRAEEGNRQQTTDTDLPAAAHIPARAGARTEQVYVRIEPYYYDELGRLAAQRRWYRSAYLANLLYAHIDRRPVLCHDEVNAVRQVARQLADIGRNVNQIARKVNIDPDHADFSTLDFELIRMLLDIETAAVKELVHANLRTWGATDVQ
ncbi:plasmid mobilization relaxosome protein MobC [Massilia pinisoli]|uniref:Plasmid mobilization relaxosome protein MobC n=1 Tax=Massilia pinisoli TaxID=1772194 RepID=A0ABT1ZZS0_9BURK|nr:plasmid mobilization relaxosome protein MobC [Massilia pinisoli]MCS0585437.1 plasmid mobilization relaxosome protein MobC [Massilia pinisoli]